MNQLNKSIRVLSSHLIPIGLGLLSVHFILKNYGETLFAIFNILLAVLTFCSVLDLGMSRILSQSTAEKYKDSAKKSNKAVLDQDINGAITFSFVAATIISVLGIFFLVGKDQNPWNLNSAEWALLQPSLIWTLLSVPIIVVTATMKGALEGLNEFSAANRIQTLSSILIYLAPLLFSFFTQDLLWPFIGQFILRIVLFLYTKSELSRYFKLSLSLNIKNNREIFSSSLWISLTTALSSALLYSDRFILIGRFNLENIGPYTTAIDLVLRALIIPQALSRLMLPVFTHDRSSTKNLVENTNFYFLSMGALVALPLLVLNYWGKPIVQLWLTDEFGARVHSFIPWLTLGIAVNSISWVAFNLLQARKEFKYLFYIQLLSALAYLVAFKVLEPTTPQHMIYLWSSRFIFDAFLFYGFLKWKYSEIPQKYAWMVNGLVLLLWWPSLF